MASSIAYTRDTDRYDWVWVLRATQGRATARDLSMGELVDAIAQMSRSGLTDNHIAELLRTSIRLVRNHNTADRSGGTPLAA